VLLAYDPDAPRAKTAVIKSLAKSYGADVCQVDHLEAAASEHGQLVPQALCEWAKRPDDVWSGAGVAPTEEMVRLAEKVRETGDALDEFMKQWRSGEITAAEARKMIGVDPVDG
jgi:hypothetical protein